MDGAEAVCPRTFGGAYATVVVPVVALVGGRRRRRRRRRRARMLFNTTRILALDPFHAWLVLVSTLFRTTGSTSGVGEELTFVAQRGVIHGLSTASLAKVTSPRATILHSRGSFELHSSVLLQRG